MRNAEKCCLAKLCPVHNFHWMMYAPIEEIVESTGTQRNTHFPLSFDESKEENSYFFLFVCVPKAQRCAYHFPHFFSFIFAFYLAKRVELTGKMRTNGKSSFRLSSDKKHRNKTFNKTKDVSNDDCRRKCGQCWIRWYFRLEIVVFFCLSNKQTSWLNFKIAFNFLKRLIAVWK